MKVLPVHPARLGEDGKIHLLNKGRYAEYLSKFKPGEHLDVIVDKAKRPRSRQVEKFHWGVQVKLWSEHTGLRGYEAHMDLLQRFPVEGVSGDGEVFKKTSSDMDSQEYYQWVFDILMQGMAEEGIVCPNPNEVHVR